MGRVFIAHARPNHQITEGYSPLCYACGKRGGSQVIGPPEKTTGLVCGPIPSEVSLLALVVLARVPPCFPLEAIHARLVGSLHKRSKRGTFAKCRAFAGIKNQPVLRKEIGQGFPQQIIYFLWIATAEI